MKFINEAHEKFYQEKIANLTNDVYHKALIYTFGVCSDTRKNFNRLYSISEKAIMPEAISEGWQTGTSAKVTRLAFQLFTDSTPTANQDISECKKYSVSDIFCCEYAPFFIEAVRIRYPEYFR